MNETNEMSSAVIVRCRIGQDGVPVVSSPAHFKCPRCGRVYGDHYALPIDDAYRAVSTTGPDGELGFFVWELLECPCGYVLRFEESSTPPRWLGKHEDDDSWQVLSPCDYVRNNGGRHAVRTGDGARPSAGGEGPVPMLL